jgi:selenophosphate synthetase-related protein
VSEQRSAAHRLDEVVQAVRSNPSIAAKRDIQLVGDVLGESGWIEGPGDDGAVVSVGGANVIACGEAIWPPFVAADPYAAGIAAVLANVNDVAAMGGVPLAIVDTVVASRQTARTLLEGMRYASSLYRVPIVGGHLTITDGPASLSAFAVGHAEAVLSSTNVASGQHLVVVACTEGRMRVDFPFFASFDERGDRLGDDVRLLSAIAARGLARGAKDISMAGLVGSLAMLLEWGSFGVMIDVDAVPSPRGVPLGQWFNCFPCFGFLLTCEPETAEECISVFVDAGLAAASVGMIDETGVISVAADGEIRHLLDARDTPATGLGRTQA